MTENKSKSNVHNNNTNKNTAGLTAKQSPLVVPPTPADGSKIANLQSESSSKNINE